MLIPIPPAPNIRIDLLFLTFASYTTAPNPVVKAQPNITASFSEIPLGILVILFSETTANSLNVVTFPALIFFYP